VCKTLKQTGDYCICDITDCTSLKYIGKIWILYFGLGYLGQYCNWIWAGQPGFDFAQRQVWDQPISCWVDTVDCDYVHTYISACVQYTYIIHSFFYSFVHFLEPEFSPNDR